MYALLAVEKTMIRLLFELIGLQAYVLETITLCFLVLLNWIILTFHINYLCVICLGI